MKKIGCFALLVLMSGAVQCSEWGQNLSPYAGVDAQVRFMEFKKGFGDVEFRQRFYPQGNVFLGLKFNPYFGVELGYFNTFTARNKSVASLNVSFGNAIPVGEVDISNTKASLNGFNANLVGFWPLDECNQLIGQIGVNRTRVKLVYEPFANETGRISPAGMLATRRDFVAKKYIATAKIGILHSFTEMFAMRVLVGWENTGKFKNIGTIQTSQLKASLKDSFTLGLGFILNF